MPHRHTWRPRHYCLLALPVHDLADRFVAWTCAPCDAYCIITGEVVLGTPLHPPLWWEAQQQRERQQPTPEGRVAAQEQRWRIE